MDLGILASDGLGYLRWIFKYSLTKKHYAKNAFISNVYDVHRTVKSKRRTKTKTKTNL